MTALVPYLVLASHVLFVFLVLAIVFRRSWGGSVINLVGKHALWLAFLAAVVAVTGSLFYSEVIGFEPCPLCWWQRVFLYPLVVIFGLAIWKPARPDGHSGGKNNFAFFYAVPLALLASLVSLYQYYASMGGASLLPCTAVGGACDKIYVLAFGYITIPLMGLTIALYILLFAWINKIYSRESRTK